MKTSSQHEAVQERIDVRQEEEFLSTVFTGAETDSYHILLLFAGAAYAACHLNAWCFDAADGKVLNSFSAHEKDLAGFFVIGGCLDYVAAHSGHHYPYLLSDGLGMVWIAEFSHEAGKESSLLFVFGPVFTSATSPLVITDNLDRMNFSFTIRRQLEKVLDEVPVLSNSMIEQYARMLHFALTGEPCDPKHFLLQKAKVEIDLFSEKEEAKYEDLNGTHAPLERVLATEQELLDMVREGRRDEKRLAGFRAGADYTDYAEGDPTRSAKDELIILSAKYMLTAEGAGVPARICRTMQLRYVRLIEKCRSVTELADIEHSMTEDFITRVEELKAAPEKSREIMIAEDYIRNNLQKPLSIDDVAKQVGYSGYYLSRKFARETGLVFADYVNRERVRYAQTLLRTTELPVQAISDMLQFSGLSYFGRVFKKFTGQTPKGYREGKTG